MLAAQAPLLLVWRAIAHLVFAPKVAVAGDSSEVRVADACAMHLGLHRVVQQGREFVTH